MRDVVAHRMVVLVLDDHRPRAAVDGHVEHGRAGQQDAPKLARVDGKCLAFPVLAAIDDAGHEAAAAQASRRARAALAAVLDFQLWTLLSRHDSGGG